MAHERLRYDFTFVGGEYNAYLFTTDVGIVYNVTFTPTPYLFGAQAPFSQHTFELSLLIGLNPTEQQPPFNRLTARTLAAIFKDFYVRSDETVTLYICASSDGRQLLRQRLFHRWFDYFDRDDYTKIDGGVRDSAGLVYPMSLIFKRTNPYASQIAAEFVKIINGYGSDK
ncbi:hypothetical protein J2I47_20355 [Fibrella sp. HMF5335]|uniref:Uncharacterized protein n=1 Tax=Fibrella rubiginis TaxID=2817060 RepID=A0A939GLG3_9BACT|nr:DUF6169 family protein [Fibrella rubiginis]MBO0938916.1 hypothetical protein [Fibrella rubiginis]